MTCFIPVPSWALEWNTTCSKGQKDWQRLHSKDWALSPFCKVLPGSGLEAEGWCTFILVKFLVSQRLWSSVQQSHTCSGGDSNTSTFIPSLPSKPDPTLGWEGQGNRERMNRREKDEVFRNGQWTYSVDYEDHLYKYHQPCFTNGNRSRDYVGQAPLRL